MGAAFLIDDGQELWVDKLATHPGFRGRGIGSALMRRTFVLAHARGRRATCLSTDSTTGALPFYERLGMQVTRSFTHWAIPLGVGQRAMTQGQIPLLPEEPAPADAGPAGCGCATRRPRGCRWPAWP